MKLIAECARCKKEFIYTNLKDMEQILHFGDTDVQKKCNCIDGSSCMMCNDCINQYKIFETKTNVYIKERLKNFMEMKPNV